MSETPEPTIDLAAELAGQARVRRHGWLHASYDDPSYRATSVALQTRGADDARQADVQLFRAQPGRPDSQRQLLVTWEIRHTENDVPDPRSQWVCRRIDQQPGATSVATEHVTFYGALGAALGDASGSCLLVIDDLTR